MWSSYWKFGLSEAFGSGIQEVILVLSHKNPQPNGELLMANTKSNQWTKLQCVLLSHWFRSSINKMAKDESHCPMSCSLTAFAALQDTLLTPALSPGNAWLPWSPTAFCLSSWNLPHPSAIWGRLTSKPHKLSTNQRSSPEFPLPELHHCQQTLMFNWLTRFQKAHSLTRPVTLPAPAPAHQQPHSSYQSVISRDSCL